MEVRDAVDTEPTEERSYRFETTWQGARPENEDNSQLRKCQTNSLDQVNGSEESWIP